VCGSDEAQVNSVVEVNNKKISYIMDDDKSEQGSVGRKISFIPNQLINHEDDDDLNKIEEFNKKFAN